MAFYEPESALKLLTFTVISLRFVYISVIFSLDLAIFPFRLFPISIIVSLVFCYNESISVYNFLYEVECSCLIYSVNDLTKLFNKITIKNDSSHLF